MLMGGMKMRVRMSDMETIKPISNDAFSAHLGHILVMYKQIADRSYVDDVQKGVLLLLSLQQTIQ